MIKLIYSAVPSGLTPSGMDLRKVPAQIFLAVTVRLIREDTADSMILQTLVYPPWGTVSGMRRDSSTLETQQTKKILIARASCLNHHDTPQMV